MNEIALVENKDGILVVSSRLVAENFGKRHSDVLEKVLGLSKEIQRTENSAGYFIPNKYVDTKGEQRPEYLLTRDGFSLLVMGFTGKEALEWKLKYIDAFNKMEAEIKRQNALSLPKNYVEALRELLASEEEKLRLEAANAELLPKAEYYNAVLSKSGLLALGVIAKDVGLPSATELNRIMFQNGIIYKQGGVWKPYAEYEWLITEGFADYESYTNVTAKPHLKWTEKGRKWIVESLPEWKEQVDKCEN